MTVALDGMKPMCRQSTVFKNKKGYLQHKICPAKKENAQLKPVRKCT